MNTNVRSVFILTQLAVPHLIKTKGNIVNISSVAGLRSVSTFCTSYSVSQITGISVLQRTKVKKLFTVPVYPFAIPLNCIVS
jgi:NADP-dependent 3-hydroxy acid dehydrogenase YdfG